MKDGNNNKGELLAATEGRNVNPFSRDKRNASDLQLFVTYDSKAKSYDHPVFVKSKEVLMRDLINLMNDPKNQYAARVLNAEDYSLFHIGSYSFETGAVTVQNHDHVCNFHDLRAMSNWRPPTYDAQKPPSAEPNLSRITDYPIGHPQRNQD